MPQVERNLGIMEDAASAGRGQEDISAVAEYLAPRRGLVTDAYRDADLVVELVDALDAGNERFVARLVVLVNAAYAETEGSLWVDGRTRIDAERLSASIAAGDIAVARWDGVVVGCVRVERLGPETYGFGLLATDDTSPRRRHRTRARGLRRADGTRARGDDDGARAAGPGRRDPSVQGSTGRLVPAPRVCAVGRRTVEEVEPGAERLLAIPCEFVIYRKTLAPSDV